jgi:hypothetical protein
MENCNPEYYVVIPTHIVAARNISQTAKLLYGVITSFWQTRGVCWATNARLAEAMGNCDERTVSRAIGELKTNGYIVTEKEGRSSRKIYLTVCAADGQSIDNSVHPDMTILSNPLDKTVYPIHFIKKENKKEKIDHNSVFVSWIQETLGDTYSRDKKNELYTRLIEYRDMRQEGNSPLNTSRKINGLLNDLQAESGGSVDVMLEMLRKATNNCWKSVHGPKANSCPVAVKPQGGREYEEL